jgi:hypothetical protein
LVKVPSPLSGVQVAVDRPWDALLTGPSRICADAGAAHEAIKARHDTSPEMTIPGNFDL